MFYYLIASGLNKSFSILLSPVLLLFFDSELVGAFVLFILIVNLFSPVVSLNLPAVIIQNKERFNILLSQYNQYVGILFLFFTLSFFVSLSYWEFGAYYLVGAVSESLYLTYLAVMRSNGKKRVYFLVTFAKIFFFSLFCAIGYSIFSESPNVLISSYVISNILVSIFFWIKCMHNNLGDLLRMKFKPERLSFGFGLLPHQLGQWLSNSGGRFIISFTIGLSALATFTQAIALSIPIIVLNSALIIYLPRKLVDGFDEFRNSGVEKKVVNLLFIYTMFVSTLTLVLVFLVYFGFEFDKVDVDFVSLAFVIGCAYVNYAFYIVFVNYLFYEKKSFLISLLTLKYAFFSVLLCMPLSYLFNEIGAATALWVSSVYYTYSTYKQTLKCDVGVLPIFKKFTFNFFVQFLTVLIIILERVL